MNTPLGGRPDPRSRDFARSASSAVARGLGLILLAVILGIVLLQIVDDGSTGPVATPEPDETPETTTVTTTPPDGEDGGTSETTTSAPAPELPERAKEEVRVLVLNGGAPSGSAGLMSDNLATLGYVNRLPANNDDQERDGNAVMCREGFEQEATTLAIAVGPETPIVEFRDPAPPFSEEADCVVIVGTPV